MDYTGAAHPKPGPHTQKKRSAKRAKGEKADRKTIAETEPLCRKCGRPANDVDHRKNRGMGGSWNPDILSMDNKQPLCRDCHNAKKGKSEPDSGKG